VKVHGLRFAALIGDMQKNAVRSRRIGESNGISFQFRFAAERLLNPA
jgi:hypothetical protein